MRVTSETEVVRGDDCVRVALTGTWVPPERATRDEPGSGGYVEDVQATYGPGNGALTGLPFTFTDAEERAVVQAWEEELSDGAGLPEEDYDRDDD